MTGPITESNNFGVKPAAIMMIQREQFAGLSRDEEPHVHLAHFSRLCGTIKLRLFPFSLKDEARNWFYSLETGTISTWDEMACAFLDKYYPLAKASKLWADIWRFRQMEDEGLYEAWERFNGMLRKCPTHGLDESDKITAFYYGCNYDTKQWLDCAAGGSVMKKTCGEATKVIENMAASSYR
ncbi:uncharacterized protein LOC125186609 [Salvia hispanica]|uniref:uncharacterized protein LOC125186609 n=1 Tax=Salvia hispanica TaxID=49212 RepID=UPI002008F136|nr:uncharacterized protein LOC125186609 [Salvia hispanica]